MISHLCSPLPPKREDNFITPSLPFTPTTCCLHFSSPITRSRWEVSPFLLSPESQKQYTRSRNSKGQRSHLGKSIFGCEGASPGPVGRGGGDRPQSWGRQ